MAGLGTTRSFAFFGGLVVSQIAVLILCGVWVALSDTALELEDDSSFVVVASAVNQLVFVGDRRVRGAASRARFARRDFGLVRAPFWQTVALSRSRVMVSYFVILGDLQPARQPRARRRPETSSAPTPATSACSFFALLVAVLAPIAEEIFFRGHGLPRALRTASASGSRRSSPGVLFGALHIDSLSSERLLQVVPLAVLGILFALLYVLDRHALFPDRAARDQQRDRGRRVRRRARLDFGLVLAGVLWMLMMLRLRLRLPADRPQVGPRHPVDSRAAATVPSNMLYPDESRVRAHWLILTGAAAIARDARWSLARPGRSLQPTGIDWPRTG